jgi:filamentous hemagglutinin family protein
MVVNWNTFNIGTGAAVNFVQPNASAVALNRVLSTDPSQIFGSLTSNGKVFLTNPSGVLFGANAKVDVGGMVATTLSISDADFLAGRTSGSYAFSGSGSGSVVNLGEINAASGGYVALLAPEVRNEGVITARLGTVALAGGNKVTLDVSGGDGLIKLAVNEGAANALASNKGLIQADGGVVYMGAKGAGDLAATVVNNEGVIEAKGLVERDGKILLVAQDGSASMSGTLNASAGDATANGGDVRVLAMDAGASFTGNIEARGGSAGGDGGFVEVSGKRVGIEGMVDTRAANGQTGTFLIDPTDITISTAANSGTLSNAAGTFTDGATTPSNINTTTLINQLATTNVVVDTTSALLGDGDITVQSSFAWASANKLTLQATRDVVVNVGQSIANSGSGGLTFVAGRNVQLDGGVSLNGGAFQAGTTAARIGGSFASTAAGVISTTSGTVTIAATGSTTIGGVITNTGTVDISGTTGINLSANVGSANAGIRLRDAVTLGANLAVNSEAGAGDIQFDSTTNGTFQLTVQAGTGSATFTGAVGAITPLTALTITGNAVNLNNIGAGASGVNGNTSVTATGALTFNGTTYNANQQTYAAASFAANAGATTTFTSTADLIQFSTGNMSLANGSNLSVQTAGGNVVLQNVAGNSSETVTLNAAAGQIQVGNIGSSTDIGAVSITGDAGVAVGSVITNGGDLAISSTGLVQLNGATLDTTNGGAAAAGTFSLIGNTQLNTDVTIRTDGTAAGDSAVTIASSVDALAAGTQGLTIQAGTADVSVTAEVGATALKHFVVSASNDFLASANITTSGAGGVAITADTFGLQSAINAGANPTVITTDTIDLSHASASLAGAGALTIKGRTAGTTIGVGDAAVGGLNIDATNEFGKIGTSHTSVTFGSNTGTGAIDVRALVLNYCRKWRHHGYRRRVGRTEFWCRRNRCRVDRHARCRVKRRHYHQFGYGTSRAECQPANRWWRRKHHRRRTCRCNTYYRYRSWRQQRRRHSVNHR